MLTVIVNQNRASKDKLNDLVAQLKNSKECQIALVKGDDLANEVGQAVQRSSSNTFILMDAGLDLDTDKLAQVIKFVNSQPHNSVRCMPLTSGTQSFEIEDISLDNLVNFICRSEQLPFLCSGFSKNIFEKAATLRGTSVSEIAAEIMICAISQGEMISSAAQSLAFSSEMGSQIELSDATRSRLLRRAIETCNIEDLFPNHPWEKFQQESAAACYHSLAAMFVRLGDLQTAGECLNLSDSFEDSPRSLALKAIIAQQKGETLGAVANMVSSLQQYELRKKNESDAHYLSFSPNDLEVINENLKSGLAALNKRDNESALKHFSTAVFNFDSFYTQHGLN